MEVRTLGRFVPSAWEPDAIEQGFHALECLPACCRRERMSVRVPHDRAPAPHPDNLQWHQDGGGSEGTTHHMVVWASEQPTELRMTNGMVFIPEPYDVVWFDNTQVFHRQPTGTNEQARWFMAIRCSGALV